MTDEKKLLEAQQAVLGAMLIDEKTVGPVLQDVTPDDFTTGAYRRSFLPSGHSLQAARRATP